jgi:transposase
MSIIILTHNLSPSWEVDMPEEPSKNSKSVSLKKSGTFNMQSEKVKHSLFQGSEFFDARDLVQVKYEMVRQVIVDKQPVSASARAFGFSRPSFYQAQTSFSQQGLDGLIPRKRGPRKAHKLSPEVMMFVTETRTVRPATGFEELSILIQEKFGIQVHPRSIERRLLREKKRQ